MDPASAPASNDSIVHTVLDLLTQPAWCCDARARITAANAAWHGYVGEVAVHRVWWLSDRLVHPDDMEPARSAWNDARIGDDPARIGLRLRRFDDRWRWHALHLSPTTDQHGSRAWIGTFTDIDGLIVEGAGNTACMHDARLERLRSQIVATVGHELRTPLTSIYGMAVTLRSRYGELSRGMRTELLDVIVSQSARMSHTIDDFLAVQRLESGHMDMHPGTCDVVRIVQQLAASMQSSRLDHSPHVVFDGTPRNVSALVDERRLRQVLGNIIDNALKYAPNSDEVHVRVRRSSTNVYVDVTDHGPGIGHDEQNLVFERFHRLDPAQVQGVAGSGLGLYIARELARRMGGDVTVRSRPRRGATFTLRVPAA